MKKMFGIFAVFAVLVATFFLSGDGFWSESQKDSYHTGISDIGGAITNPEILWKYYRGGYVNPSNVAVDDEGNIYFSLNGVVRAVAANFNQLWESENFGASRIFRITDFDKNGEKELVVGGTSGIRIVSAQSGSIFSTIPTESPSFAKIADINSDGFDELVIRGRSEVMSIKVFSFSTDIATPALLYELTSDIPIWGFEICIGDIDDNSGKEIVFDRMTGALISVFDAMDGTLLRNKSRILDGNYAYGFNQIVNVDEDAQKEFVLTGSQSSPTDKGSYSVAIYDYVLDIIQWKYEYGFNTINKGLRMVPGSVGDFNGDGTIDVIVSVFNNTLEGVVDLDGVNAPNIWTTLIYRADNGVLQARLDNTYLEGFSDLNGVGTMEIILRSETDSSKKLREYSTVSAYEFTDGDFKKLWSRDNVKIIKAMPEDPEDVGVVFVPEVPAKVSIGTAEGIIVIEDINRDGVGDKFFSLSGAGSTPVLNDVAYLLDGKSFGFISATDSKMYFSGNDGSIHVFYRGATLGSEKRIKTGNFSGDAIFVNSATGGKILTTLSTYSQLLLDLQNASSIKQPEVEWFQINQYSQPLFAFDSNGDGLHEFVSLYTDSEGLTSIYLHGSNGGLIWGWTVGKIVSAPTNFITGDFDGDGFKDIIFTFTSEEEGYMLYVLKGLDGFVLNSYDPTIYPNSYYNRALALLGDVVGSDDVDDFILFNSNTAQIINGLTLSVSASFNVYYYGNDPVSAKFDGDNTVDVFANQIEGNQKQMFDLDGNQIWKIDISLEEDSSYKYYTPYPGISKIDADEGFDLALGGKFGDISAYSGTDGSVLWRICLSEGTSTDISVEMIPTSTLCDGTNLSNIVTGDIDGDSIDEFVAGDKLGNLYVINSEDGTIVWTMKFDGAIGNPILADVNSDGKIEIVTGAGDGYLYAIGQKLEVQSPSFVRDVSIDIDGEISETADIDEMIKESSYGGIWQAVTGAQKYKVRLTKADETVLKETQVTGANQIIFSGLEVEIGDVLYLSVKTIDAGGYESEWKKSDGVTITDEEAIPDNDVMPDNDTAPDDASEDIDFAADIDDVDDVDLSEDSDPVVDIDMVPDESVNDDIVADEDADSIDDPETRSKDSGCGCSIL